MTRFFPCLFILYYLVFPAHLALAAAEAEISAKVEVDKAFVTIGDLINFRVTVVHAEDITILELNPANVLAEFEIKEVADFSRREDGKRVEGKHYVMTNYTLGEYVIPSFAIQYRTRDGSLQELKTNPIYLTVGSVDKNKSPAGDIRGVKGVHKVKGSAWPWLAVIGLCAIGIGVWIFHKRAKQASLEMISDETLTPHDEAYQALNRLKHSDLLQKGQVKFYFLKMSEILRRYFERRYEIKALESTTYEVMAALKNRLADEDYKLISEVLSFCDLAKFAKYEPPPMEIIQENNRAKQVVDRTKQEIENAEPKLPA